MVIPPARADSRLGYEWAVIAYPALMSCIVIWAFWRISGQQLMNVSTEER